MSMQTRTGVSRRGARGALDQLELLDAIDHHRHLLSWRPAGTAPSAGTASSPAPASAERLQRAAVGRRIRDEQILGPAFGEPQRLGQRERERALEPVAGKDAVL